MKIIVASLALLALAQTSSAQRTSTESKPSTWQGAVTGAPMVLDSPLAPIPDVRKGARLLTLPTPKGRIPDAVVIPFAEGGGPVTLLAPWRGGWLVGTDAGEWGGALYLALPHERVTIARGNVIGGFSWNGHLYVLSGLQHLTLDEGELWEVDLKPLRLIRRIALPAMPTDVIISKAEGVVVRSAGGDVILSPSGDVRAAGN